MAAYIHELTDQNPDLGHTEGFIIIIRTADGMPMQEKAIYLTHSDDTIDPSNPLKNYFTTSSGMFFTSYNTVVIALQLQVWDSSRGNAYKLTSSNSNYEGRMRLTSYDFSSNQIDWYREQYEMFGQATAIAYGHWGSASDSPNIYLGGIADDNKY